MVGLKEHVKSWIIPKFDHRDASLVLYLPLWYQYSDMTGTTIYSYDRNRHSGTVTSAAWGSQGRNHDGTDDIISVADAASLSSLGTTGVTIITWFKADAITENTAFVSKDSGVAGGREFTFKQKNTGGLLVALFFDNGTGYLEADSTTVLSNSVWYHAATTWNGTNAAGNINIYLNGVLEALTDDSKSGAGAVPYDGAYAVEVGRFAADNAYCFDGMIGEVLIYNRVLTAVEIQQHYLATKWRYQ